MSHSLSIAPPRPKDLPLNALRAFEVSARLGGFAAAGQELNVSPGAVSAHVKTLEEAVGAPLFQRTARGVVLTPLGRRVLPEFSRAFDDLAAAVRLLRSEAAPNTVHIATLPSVAQLWLSPRLPELRRIAPEISVSITALEEPPNLKRTPYDLCLFFDESRGQQVAEDWIFPVCAPGFGTLTDPADLRRVACITDTTWRDDWQDWAGQDVAAQGPVYSLYALALEETLNGAGVLMGHLPLVERHLAAGTLREPFGRRVKTPRALRVWSVRPTASGAARRVMDWLSDSR